MSEIDNLRQEAENLKNQIRVGLYSFCDVCFRFWLHLDFSIGVIDSILTSRDTEQMESAISPN